MTRSKYRLTSKLNLSFTHNYSMQPTVKHECPLQRDSAAADLNSYMASLAVDHSIRIISN